MPEIKLQTEQLDDLAGVVLDRYRRAKEWRESYKVFQNKSADYLLRRSRSQYAREYTPEDADSFQAALGVYPTRYFGLVEQRVAAAHAWLSDLLIQGLPAVVTVEPTPEPSIDAVTRDRIRLGVRRELAQRMAESGMADPEMLLTDSGRVPEELQAWLETQALNLKQVEQAQIVASASRAASRMQGRLLDIVAEGRFDAAFNSFVFNLVLTGRGVMRFPRYQRMPRLVHSGTTAKYEYVVTPRFYSVDPENFYPIDDSEDTRYNTGNTERTSITRSQLIDMRDQEGYFGDVIDDVLKDFEYRSRNWLDPETRGNEAPWWGLDESIPMLIHEGFFSGHELSRYGITQIGVDDYVNARVEVVGSRTIRATLLTRPDGGGRTYYQAPYRTTGQGLYDAIGMGALLWDTEQRINRLLYIFENNVSWSAMPPIMRNPRAFDNQSDAGSIRPGGTYDVEERFGIGGSMPDALRTMSTVSAQYHLLMTQINALIARADDESGIPAYTFSGAGMGRASLGEYSQRVSNALRSVKQVGYNIDNYFIQPAFRSLAMEEIQKDDNLREGADIYPVIRGMTGLMQEDLKRQKQEAILPLLLQGSQTGMVPPQAAQYGIYQALKDSGIPLDALGVTDPMIEQALAVAAQTPIASSSAATQQAPSVDGRSGPMAPGAVAGADGSTMIPQNLAQTGPIA